MQKAEVILSAIFFIIFFSSIGTSTDNTVGELAFKAKLLGSEEVPLVNTGAKGEATFQISKGGDTLTYKLIVLHIKDVTAAYIHVGRKGENGPPGIELFSEPKKEDVSGTLLAEGKIEPYLFIGPLKGKTLNSIIQLMESGEAYVNIRTKKHPDGEIRGQIK
jgi:hypothetical protein